jgi:hypothetical protein
VFIKHYYGDKVKQYEIGGSCSMHRTQAFEMLTKYFVKGPEWNRPLWRHGCKWDYNIKMDLKEIGFEGVAWINLAPNRDQWRASVNTILKFEVGNFWCSWAAISFSSFWSCFVQTDMALLTGAILLVSVPNASEIIHLTRIIQEGVRARIWWSAAWGGGDRNRRSGGQTRLSCN